MASHLLNKINRCSNTHRGKTNPQPCNHDYCNCCDAHQIRTDLIVQAAVDKFAKSNTKLYHAVADIGPITSFDQGRDIAIKLLHNIAQYDIECIGSMHYADPKVGKHNVGTNTRRPFYHKLHVANAHLHWISNQYQKEGDPIRKNVFCLDYQLWQKMQGLKPFETQTNEEFVTTEIEYGRKRDRIQTTNWFKALKESDEQLTFKVSYGEVFIWNFKLNDWVQSEVKSEVKSGGDGSRKVSFQSEEEYQKGWTKCKQSLDNRNLRLKSVGPVMYTTRGDESDVKIKDKVEEKVSETIAKNDTNESKISDITKKKHNEAMILIARIKERKLQESKLKVEEEHTPRTKNDSVFEFPERPRVIKEKVKVIKQQYHTTPILTNDGRFIYPKKKAK